MTRKYSLENFLVGVTGKSKLMIYLLSTGDFSLEQIRSLTVGELLPLRNKIKKDVPSLIDTLSELTSNRDEDEYALLYTSGRRYSVNNVRDILIRAHKRCNVEYKGLDHFVEQIRKYHHS